MEIILLIVGAILGAGALALRSRFSQLSTLNHQPSSVFIRNWKPLTDEQLRAAMGGWKETDPKWRALWDALSREMEATIQDLTATGSDPQSLARWAGRLEMLVHWRSQLIAWRQMPGDESDS